MGFEAGNEVQVKNNERGDFSWLEFYGKRTKETLSGQQMVKGEIQFKPSNPEIAKRLEPTEIKFLE